MRKYAGVQIGTWKPSKAFNTRTLGSNWSVLGWLYLITSGFRGGGGGRGVHGGFWLVPGDFWLVVISTRFLTYAPVFLFDHDLVQSSNNCQYFLNDGNLSLLPIALIFLYQNYLYTYFWESNHFRKLIQNLFKNVLSNGCD